LKSNSKRRRSAFGRILSGVLLNDVSGPLHVKLGEKERETPEFVVCELFMRQGRREDEKHLHASRRRTKAPLEGEEKEAGHGGRRKLCNYDA